MTDEERKEYELAARKAHILWRLHNWGHPSPPPKRAETYDDLVLIAEKVSDDRK